MDRGHAGRRLERKHLILKRAAKFQQNTVSIAGAEDFFWRIANKFKDKT